MADDSLYTSTEDASAVSSAWLSSPSLALAVPNEGESSASSSTRHERIVSIVMPLDGFIFENSSRTDIRQTTQTDNTDAAGVPPL